MKKRLVLELFALKEQKIVLGSLPQDMWLCPRLSPRDGHVLWVDLVMNV